MDAMIATSTDGRITLWNPAAERSFGYSAAEMIGQTAARLIPPELHAEEAEILKRVLRGERVQGFHTIRQRKSGQKSSVALTLSPIRDADGIVAGTTQIIRELSDSAQGADINALLSAIVDSSDDAIISKDLNGIVTTWNLGAERVFGYTAAEMIGHPIWRLFPPDRWEEEPRILERIRRGEKVDHFETKRVRKGGVLIDVSVTISPIRDREGRIIGASKIARDISAQKQAQEKLVLVNDELRRADQMKSEFLATLSHELRTPLNAIIGWTHVLKEGDATDPTEVKEGLAVIERNARAQAQMIEDLLDVSRIVSGKVILDVQQLNLVSVVESAMQSLLPAAQAKEIRLTSAFSSVEGVVMGDRNRLQQVIWNLLSNAMKFTPKRGRVHVTIQRRNSQVEIAVADNGNGIPPQHLAQVFERFRQLDGSTTRRHSGLGLGLSIVKQLVEMHGGEVHAHSEGEGRGATFTVALPIMSARGDLAGGSRPGDAHQINSGTPLKGVRVLAVDDEPDSLQLVARILEARGAQVTKASSAAEGMQRLEESRPDILLSDIGMPEQDGYGFIRRVRQMASLSSLPAVALTALARSEDRTHALNAGFQTHVAKPVEPHELVAVVASLASLSGPREPAQA